MSRDSSAARTVHPHHLRYFHQGIAERLLPTPFLADFGELLRVGLFFVLSGLPYSRYANDAPLHPLGLAINNLILPLCFAGLLLGLTRERNPGVPQ
jgi:hypothetical protein